MEWIELNSFDFITHACVKNTFMKATYLFLTKHKYYSEKFSDRINLFYLHELSLSDKKKSDSFFSCCTASSIDVHINVHQQNSVPRVVRDGKKAKYVFQKFLTQI